MLKVPYRVAEDADDVEVSLLAAVEGATSVSNDENSSHWVIVEQLMDCTSHAATFFSATRYVACRACATSMTSVCPSVTSVNCDHIVQQMSG